MRRTAPTGPLSPQLIKHFAMATVALTGLLAIFASDADWGAQAQIGAVEANNQLLTAEAERLGTRHLAAKLVVRPGPSHRGFDEDPGYDFGERGSTSAPQPVLQTSVRARDSHSAPPLGLADLPGATEVVNSGPSPADDSRLQTAKTGKKAAPTAQELAEMTANSARRSGQSGEAD